MKRLLSFLMMVLFFSTIAWGQSITVTYTDGDIPTDHQSPWVGPSTCPGVMTVTIPAGSWITGIDVAYSMTAQNGAWMSEQRSRLFSPTTNMGEEEYFTGEGSTAGTMTYSRTGLTFANFATGDVVIHMDAGRTWGSTAPNDGCGTFYSKVDNNTWTMTIYYETIPSCPAPFNLTAGNLESTSADLSWTPVGSETTWHLKYGAPGFDPVVEGTLVSGLTATTYNLGGLSPLTHYDFYVQADCGGGDLSAWGGPGTFQTTADFISGSYTINSALPTSGTNFNNFSDLALALNTGGLDGPLTIDVVAGSGPYNEQIILGEVVGSSDVNTITINGNGETLEFLSTETGQRATLKMEGTSHVTIDNLIIKALGSDTGEWGYAVQLMENASYNTFTNCQFIANTTSTSINFAAFVASNSHTSATITGLAASNLTVENSVFEGGYYAMTISGPTIAQGGPFADNNVIINNEFRDFRLYGLYMRSNTNSLISENMFHRPDREENSTTYMIYMTQNMSGTEVINNHIFEFAGNPAAASASAAYGIYGTTITCDVGDELLIANNLVYGFENMNGIQRGIVLFTTDHVRVYHNTIALDHVGHTGASALQGIYHTGNLATIDIRNNIVSVTSNSTGVKHCLFFSQTAANVPVLTSDNNVLYMGATAGTNHIARWGGSDYTTLADWQTADGGSYDQASVDDDPMFVDLEAGDLTPQSPFVDNIGADLTAFVPFDIFGEPRSTTPDPGAIEFEALGDGYLSGVVRDAVTNDPIINATVSVAGEEVVTLADGAFEFTLMAGDYTVTVTKPGYTTLHEAVTIMPGTLLEQDMILHETANAPGPVLAELNEPETAVNLTWGLPSGQYEIIYDDGVADNVTAWGIGGNMNALRFTPAGYPTHLISGSVNIFDGTYPPGGNALVPFEMAVYDDSGPAGYPGEELGVVNVTPADFGWVHFDLTELDITINSGDFYLVMIQGGNFPNCAPIAIDETNPVMRSYSRFVTGGAPWTPAGFNDFMMRAIVEGPGGPGMLAYSSDELIESDRVSRGALFMNAPPHVVAPVGPGIYKPIEGTGTPDRAAIGYHVYQLAEGDEGDEALWTMLGSPTGTSFVDNSWPDLDDGSYRWAVKAEYPLDVLSEPTFSNVLGKNWSSDVTVVVTLSDPNVSPAGIQVGLQNTVFPQYNYNATTDEEGEVNFPEVWKGNYDLVVYKFGYDPFELNVDVTDNAHTFTAHLLETTHPPSALFVDPLMIHATWVAPGVSLDLLEEDWSSGGFAANEWTFDPTQGNWSVTTLAGNPAPAARFNWSPSVTNYSYALVSKELSGLGMPNVMLQYDLNLSNFSTATVEQMAVEVWNGSSWVQVVNYTNAGGSIPWTTYTHDITAHAQGQMFKVRFRAHGADSWNINNWNIDNIAVYGEVADGGTRAVLGYFVYLDDVVAGFAEETNFQFQPDYINYGQTYTAGVQAVYESGFSDMITYVFTSQFLYPPCYLEGEDIGHAVELTWDAPGVCDPFGGTGGGPGGPGGSWSQDFEGGSLPAGWNVQQTNSGTSGPVPGFWTVNNYSSAEITPFGNYHVGLWWDFGHQDEWLITPEFECDASSVLSFWTSVFRGSTHQDHYYVKVSTDGGTNWEVIWDASTLSGGWNYYVTPYDISLADFAGQDIKVAFNAVDGPGNDGLWYVWFLDNIAVSSGTRTIRFDAESLTRVSKGTSGGQETHLAARDGNIAAPEIPRSEFSEYSPVTGSYEPQGERALFDLLASWPVGVGGGEYAVATDGQFMYTAAWNSANFYKYTLTGTYLESFTISGAGNLRDLTFDGQYFYGAPNTTTIYQMDFTNQSVVGTITAPAAVRGIAYDADNDGFWVTNGWNPPIRLISRTGAVLETVNSVASSLSGLGWEKVSDGTPYLWAYTQPASNNILVKIDIATGATLQTFDVASVVTFEPGSISGGMDITNLLIPGKWVFLGTAQNDLIWVLELADDTGTGPGAPVETAGFRIYRDGSMIAEVDNETFSFTDSGDGDFLPAGTYNYSITAIYEHGEDIVESLHEGPISVEVEPGFGFVNGLVFDAVTFQPIEGVEVTAGEFSTTTQANGTYSLVAYEGVYDIHFDKIGYALHVEEGFEIVWEQTQTLNVELTPQDPNFPFEEDWSSGSFATQNWTFMPSQGNWRMNNTTGNPAPSAEFNWSPSTTNYSFALTSEPIDARAALENVTFEYDIFLNNFSATSAEFMTVEIWDGEEWVFVAEYKNDADIPWTNHQHDVTEHAAGKMTQIRFVANGANSFNLNWWLVDNIKLHTILPPEISVTPDSLIQALVVGQTATQELTILNLGDGALNFNTQIDYLDDSNDFVIYPVPPGEKVVVSDMDVSLAQGMPGGHPDAPARNEVVLNYDGPNFDAIGLTDGGTFHLAARFPSAMVGQYAGYVLTSVDVYINDVPSNANLKIWGAGTGSSPGDILHQQPFTSTPDSWINIELSNPVVLDGTDIWVGYDVTHGAGQFPAGCDAGPANPNGDWISIDGVVWEHLAGFGLNYNWNIRARLNPGEGFWLSVSPTSGNVEPGGSQILTAEFDATGLDIGLHHANILIHSNDPDHATVTIPVTLDVLVGIGELEREAVMVYPVPASDLLTVVTSQGISHVRMFSYTGQLVYDSSIPGESTINIDVKPFNTGAYILQFITQDGQTFNKRILISK